MVQTGVDKLLRCLLVEQLLRSGDATVTARELADDANRELASLVRAPWNTPVGRMDVEHALTSAAACFQKGPDGWRLSQGFRAALTACRTDRPHFSPRRVDAPARELHRWQAQALERWRSSGRHGIVAAVTGSGKTMLGLAAIEQHLCVPSARAVVLVPTVELLHQWRRELAQTFFVTVGAAGDTKADHVMNHMIVVFVARSASEWLAPEVSRIADAHAVLLVADECHRYGAESYARALKALYAATLGLSATPERDHDSGMERHVFPALGPVVYEYGHERAVAEAVVSDFRVLFVGVEFERHEQEEHDELSRQIARARNALCAAYPFLERAHPFVEAIKTLAGRDEDELALRWLALVGERRRMLCNAGQRQAFVRWFAARPELSDLRMLVFHESIADCAYLAETLARAGIPAKAHHSELERFERAAVLDAFAEGKLQAVVAPHTLDEGIDVPDAALAVIVAGSRVRRQSIQRIGRVLRRANGKRLARVIKVFVRGAADDPTAAHPDRFSKAMLESGRGRVVLWPEQASEVVAFVSLPLVSLRRLP